MGDGLELPCKLRLQAECAAGVEITLRLLQLQRVQQDLLRRAIQVQREFRQLPRRSNVDIAFSVVLLRAAFDGQVAVAVELLAHQIGRQFEILPGNSQISADRPCIQLDRA